MLRSTPHVGSSWIAPSRNCMPICRRMPPCAGRPRRPSSGSGGLVIPHGGSGALLQPARRFQSGLDAPRDGLRAAGWVQRADRRQTRHHAVTSLPQHPPITNHNGPAHTSPGNTSAGENEEGAGRRCGSDPAVNRLPPLLMATGHRMASTGHPKAPKRSSQKRRLRRNAPLSPTWVATASGDGHNDESEWPSEKLPDAGTGPMQSIHGGARWEP